MKISTRLGDFLNNTKKEKGFDWSLLRIDWLSSHKQFGKTFRRLAFLVYAKKFNRFLCVQRSFAKICTREHHVKTEKTEEKASFGYYYVLYTTTYYTTKLLTTILILTTTRICETSDKLLTNF